MPLEKLFLRWCTNISGEGFAYLAGAPLTKLDVRCCPMLGGFELLRGLPLTYLNLHGCRRLSDPDLVILSEMLLTSVELSECQLLTDECVAPLLAAVRERGVVKYGARYSLPAGDPAGDPAARSCMAFPDAESFMELCWYDAPYSDVDAYSEVSQEPENVI